MVLLLAPIRFQQGEFILSGTQQNMRRHRAMRSEEQVRKMLEADEYLKQMHLDCKDWLWVFIMNERVKLLKQVLNDKGEK
jgi:hypothetical protein